MNKILAIVISLLFLFLFGCQSASTVETTEAAPVSEAVVLTPTPQATQPAPTDHCLECHTDQEMLTTLAKPEVKAEGESKGVG